MDVKKIKESVNLFKDFLGDGLISSDIWDEKDGLSLASYNANDRFSALFAHIVKLTKESLNDLAFPELGAYQITNLSDNQLLLIINIENKYFWGSLINTSQISLGELLFIIIPKAKESLLQALALEEKTTLN